MDTFTRKSVPKNSCCFSNSNTCAQLFFQSYVFQCQYILYTKVLLVCHEMPKKQNKTEHPPAVRRKKNKKHESWNRGDTLCVWGVLWDEFKLKVKRRKTQKFNYRRRKHFQPSKGPQRHTVHSDFSQGESFFMVTTFPGTQKTFYNFAQNVYKDHTVLFTFQVILNLQ